MGHEETGVPAIARLHLACGHSLADLFPYEEDGLRWPGPCGESLAKMGLVHIGGGRPLGPKHEPVVMPGEGWHCRCGDYGVSADLSEFHSETH